MNDTDLLKRITVNPKIFGGKPAGSSLSELGY
jgi:uncharacterized protein (DUF433 family)